MFNRGLEMFQKREAGVTLKETMHTYKKIHMHTKKTLKGT